jgi:hypothetical protein
MRDFTQQLHDELLSKLGELDKNYDPGILPDPRMDLIVSAIDQIKEKLKTHRFLSEEDEIHYFKSVLPVTLSLHIYYSDRIEWDRIRLQGSPECRYQFTDRIYSQAENFRTVHKDFYEYCRDGKAYLDRFYFLRDSPANREKVYPLRSIIDRNSPTIYCEMTARLMAYTRLEQELHRSVSENKESAAPEYSDKPVLVWTLPKIKLIEIIYALKVICAFNNGQAELAVIQECFEKMFGISLGNISRSFQEILARKKGYTPFLDQLKECLLKRISEIEEGNMKMNMR